MDVRNVKVGFIGFGNIAGAVCDGLLIRKAVDPANVYASARNWDKLKARCDVRGINACETAAEVIAASDFVIMGVLSDQVETVVKENADALRGVPVFSLSSKVFCSDFDRFLGEGYNHICGLPNLSTAVGEGIIVAEAEHTLTEEQFELFESLIGQAARIEYFKKEMMGVADIGAGCAPAFADMFVEALSDGLVKYGMPRAQAYSIVPQMLIGTAAYMMQSHRHPGDLKDSVCTPGGNTIKGISALEEKGFRHALISAVDAIMGKN
ncbi:MAG: NAD(P)-binding domain-containing protein [Mogibacterium sp.]|nr:NAD(P)-binding domain-containing protein [Mogibacterium sp.]